MAYAQLKPFDDESVGIANLPDNPLISPQVDLAFTASPIGQSYLSKQIGKYPYHIGRLIKNSSTPTSMAMLFLQCTSGGLFEHDRITIRLTAREKAIASVKHAAATVVHSMQQGHAVTHLHASAATGAYLEYTGNLNILFPNSQLNNQIEVTLHPKAITLISDAYLIHDPEQKSAYFAQLETTINVYNPQGRLLTRDRLILSGAQLAAQLGAVSNQFDTHATLYVLAGEYSNEENATLFHLVQTCLEEVSLSKQEAYLGLGRLPNNCGVFVRMICRSGQPVNQLIQAISNQLRSNHLNNDD